MVYKRGSSLLSGTRALSWAGMAPDKNMKLIIPGEMTNLNKYVNAERTNKFMAAKIKKDETERVYWECKKQGNLKARMPISEVLIDWYTKDARTDCDNLMIKAIFDGMVMAKVIPDDSRKYINAITIRAYVDKRKPRCEVEIL